MRDDQQNTLKRPLVSLSGAYLLACSSRSSVLIRVFTQLISGTGGGGSVAVAMVVHGFCPSEILFSRPLSQRRPSKLNETKEASWCDDALTWQLSGKRRTASQPDTRETIQQSWLRFGCWWAMMLDCGQSRKLKISSQMRQIIVLITVPLPLLPLLVDVCCATTGSLLFGPLPPSLGVKCAIGQFAAAILVGATWRQLKALILFWGRLLWPLSGATRTCYRAMNDDRAKSKWHNRNNNSSSNNNTIARALLYIRPVTVILFQGYKQLRPCQVDRIHLR